MTELELNLEDKVNELKAQKAEFISTKKDIESKLTVIRNLIRTSGMMSRERYRQTVDAQNNYMTNLSACEKNITRLTVEIQKAASDKNRASSERKNGEPKKELVAEPSIQWKRDVVDELCALRAFYQEFSADRDRIASKRQMAAEFAMKLNPIIKQFLRD